MVGRLAVWHSAHPEYPSGHSTVSGSAAYILAAAFGDNTAILGHIRNPAGYTILFEFLGGCRRDCRRQGIWWHSLQNILRARQCAGSVSGGVRFQPRDASSGRLV